MSILKYLRPLKQKQDLPNLLSEKIPSTAVASTRTIVPGPALHFSTATADGLCNCPAPFHKKALIHLWQHPEYLYIRDSLKRYFSTENTYIVIDQMIDI